MDRLSYRKHIGKYIFWLRICLCLTVECFFNFLFLFQSHCMSCMADVRLADLKPIGTLGVGGFGRVELIKCLRAIPAKGQRLPDSYALKVMRKGKTFLKLLTGF